jgi:O-antigen ligase
MTKIAAHSKPDHFLGAVVSLGVFLFFAGMISVPVGYTAGAVVLLLAALYCLARYAVPALSRQDKTLAWLLVAVFGIGLFSFLYHGNAVRSIDLPSRYLLAAIILLMLLEHPPKLPWLWAGFAVGAVSGAAVAAWQTVGESFGRAVGFTGVIQFGDLGLMLGVFCAAGIFWANMQPQSRRWAWRCVLGLGVLGGVYASLASGSRGGWIALPVVVLIFVAAFINSRNVKPAIVTLVVLAVAAAAVAISVPTIKHRYDRALLDVQQYEQGNADTSIGARFAIWRAAAGMIAKKPLAGWSDADYRAERERLVASKEAPPVILILANTHNNYLELWVFQGVFAVLIVLALLVTSFISFARRLRSPQRDIQALAVCGATLVAAYAIFSMSQIMLGRNNTLLFFLIALVCLWGAMRKLEKSACDLP